MKKIRITEGQYRRLFKEQEEETKFDIPDLLEPPSTVIDTLNAGLNFNIDLKKQASSDENSVTWEDMGYDVDKLPKNLKSKYPKYVPEIISGYAQKGYFNLTLLSVLKDIEDISGLDLIVTGGNDYYHQTKRKGSNHNTGNAIDFVVSGSEDDETQKKIEKVVLGLAKGKYPKIAFINEFKTDTGGTGGHFHLSLMSRGEKNYYHFIDNGLRIEGDPDFKEGERLSFKGNGNNLKKIMFDTLKKENPITKIEPLKAKTLKIDIPKNMPSIDIKAMANTTVKSMGEMKRKEIKNNIKQYDNYINRSTNDGEKEYFISVRDELVKLLGTNEV